MRGTLMLIFTDFIAFKSSLDVFTVWEVLDECVNKIFKTSTDNLVASINVPSMFLSDDMKILWGVGVTR